jgi:hypothetical protein
MGWNNTLHIPIILGGSNGRGNVGAAHIHMTTTIYNSELTKEIIDGARLQTGTSVIPSELGQTVVPVMEVNPRLLRFANILKSATGNNSTSSTIYTTPVDKDFYLTGASLSVIKDVTATSVQTAINVVPIGFTTGSNICVLAGITLTPQTLAVSQNFNPPLKIARNTVIATTNSANTANIRAEASIVGYTVDNINA